MSDAKKGKYATAARRLAEILGNDTVALVGGLAVSAWGFVRGTQDIDFMTTKNPEEIQERLKVQGVESHFSRGREDDPLPWFVAGNLDGIPFDIIPQVAGAQVANGVFVEPLGIRILDIVDLIAVKCYAGSPKDILDVANLMRTRPDLRETTCRIAEKYGHGKMLEIFLSDRPHVSKHFPEGQERRESS